jgi:ABC-type Mn2+/Zn2+ transport system permease subunit
MLHLIELLGLPFLACLTMIAILSYLGIHVLMREVIFIDIALAQIAAIGAIIAHLTFAAHGDSAHGYVCAFGLTLLASAFYSFVRRKITQVPLEAIIGVSYAIAAAAAMFLVGVVPGGHMHVQQMLAGSILWTTWRDLFWCALVFSVVGFCFYFWRKPFRRISDNYESAQRAGMKVVQWDFLFYTLLGIVITLAVRIGGVVLVFAFLIIPATISALFSSRWGVRLLIAWAIGGIVTIMGLLFSRYLDFSVGPAIGLFLGSALILMALSRLLKPAFAISIIAIFLIAFGAVCFVGNRSESLNKTSKYEFAHIDNTAEMLDMPEQTLSLDQIYQVNDIGDLERFFKNVTAVEVSSAIVCRALELETRTGVRLGLEFLSNDSPLFFRQLVIDKLEDAIDGPTGFDIEKSFTDTVNQKAAFGLMRKYDLSVPGDEQ